MRPIKIRPLLVGVSDERIRDLYLATPMPTHSRDKFIRPQLLPRGRTNEKKMRRCAAPESSSQSARSLTSLVNTSALIRREMQCEPNRSEAQASSLLKQLPVGKLRAKGETAILREAEDIKLLVVLELRGTRHAE